MANGIMKMINKELVKKFAEGAAEFCKTQPREIAGSMWEEKFAELIVRKCGDIAFEQWCVSDQMSARAEILKQFGLEE